MTTTVTRATTKTVLQALLASALIITLGAPLLPGTAHAQDPAESEQAWYQIEVIVFAQSDSFGNEQNLKSVQLGYPRQQVFLDSNNAEPSPEMLARLSPEDLALYRAMTPQERLERRDPLTPIPFATLPASERLLNEEARSLERSGPFRVLYHQAWRQTLDGPRNSPWVIVRGGQATGDHHELEGSLRIYSDDQIFAETRLWRARFGQPQPQQPVEQAPQQPGGLPGTEPEGHTTSPLAPDDAAATQPASEPLAPAEAKWPALPTPPSAPKPGLPPIFQAAVNQAPQPAVDIRDTGTQPPQQGPQVVDLDLLEMKQIINSRELHYLDHPRLGALIRVVPYNPEQPEEEEFGDPLEEETAEPDYDEPMPENADEVMD